MALPRPNVHQEGYGAPQTTIVPNILTSSSSGPLLVNRVVPPGLPANITNITDPRFVLHSHAHSNPHQQQQQQQHPSQFIVNANSSLTGTFSPQLVDGMGNIHDTHVSMLATVPTPLDGQFHAQLFHPQTLHHHHHHHHHLHSNPTPPLGSGHIEPTAVMIQHDLSNSTDKSPTSLTYSLNKTSPNLLSSPLMTDSTSPNISSSENSSSTDLKTEITSISNPSVTLSNSFASVPDHISMSAQPTVTITRPNTEPLTTPAPASRAKLSKKNSVKATSPTKRRRANTAATTTTANPTRPKPHIPASLDATLPCTEVRVVRLDEKDNEKETLFHHQLSSGQASSRSAPMSTIPLERTKVKDKKVSMDDFFSRDMDLRDLRECSRRVPYRNYFSLLNDQVQNSRSQRMTKSLVKNSNFITKKQRSWIEQKIEQSLSNIIEQSGYLSEINLFGTGLRKVYFCPKFCLAFTGEYTNHSICPKCKSEKEDTVFGWYICPISQLSELMKDPELAQIITHPHEPDPDYIRDVWDGDLCSRTLPARGFVKNGDGPNGGVELVFGASATSGNIWSSKCFEFIDINLHLFNLPHNERNNVKYMFPVFSYPKKADTESPPDHFSFFQPLVEDLRLLSKGFMCYNAHLQEYTKLTGVLAFYFGDYPSPLDALRISVENIVKYESMLESATDMSTASFTQAMLSYTKTDQMLADTPPQSTTDFTPSSIDPSRINSAISAHLSSLQHTQSQHSTTPQSPQPHQSHHTAPLPTLCSPESFPYEMIQFSFKELIKFIFTCIIGVPDPRSKAKKAATKPEFPPFFRINDEGRTILKNILKSANLNFSQNWLGITFDIDDILAGKLLDLTYTDLRGLLELFPVFCKELEGSGNDDVMQIFLAISLVIRVSYMAAVPRTFLDELQKSITAMVEDFKLAATDMYSLFYNSEGRFQLQSLVDIVYYIKNTGNLRSFWAWLTDGSIKELKESSKATRFYISALANTKLRKWHLNLMLNKPTPITFGAHKLKAIHSSSFVPTDAYLEDSEDDDEFEDSVEQITQTESLSFIAQFCSFTAWRRFKACQLQSNGIQIRVGNYARISSPDIETAKTTFTNYAKVFDLVQLTVPGVTNRPAPSSSASTGYTSSIQEYAIVKFCVREKMEAVTSHRYFPFAKNGMEFVNYMSNGISLEPTFTLIPVTHLANPVHILPLQKKGGTRRYFVDPYIFGRYVTDVPQSQTQGLDSELYESQSTVERVYELSTYDAETEINKDLRQYHINARDKTGYSVKELKATWQRVKSRGEDNITQDAINNYYQREQLWKSYETLL